MKCEKDSEAWFRHEFENEPFFAGMTRAELFKEVVDGERKPVGNPEMSALSKAIKETDMDKMRGIIEELGMVRKKAPKPVPSKEDARFVEKRPTGNFREYTPDRRWVPPVLQQEFYCVDEHGVSGLLWFELKAYIK